MTSQFARESHSVPQAYLRGWEIEPHRVWAYRLLVPHERYPTWERRHVASLTRYKDLYTSTFDGDATDSFELWLNKNIEQPAASALAKARAEQALNPEDWRRLGLYAAALDLRTPASYLEQSARWAEQIPGLLKQTVQHLKKVEPAIRSGRLKAPPSLEQHRFPMRFYTGSTAEGKLTMRVEVVPGRQLWVWDVQRILSTTANLWSQHDWSILRPHPGSTWFTSDHPMMRLNYYGEGRYDFRGGWGNPGTELILPLSPQHLMYAKVGSTAGGESTLSLEDTFLMQKLIAERAHRWIIAGGQPQRAVWFHPRTVHREMFCAEEKGWDTWDETHRAAEAPSPEPGEEPR